MPATEADLISRVLRYRHWAMVGLTGNPARTAYQIASFLYRHGTRVVPVNPGGVPIFGEPGYRELADLPEPPEVVAVYRRAAAAAEFVDAAVAIGAKAVWLPLSVVVPEAADRATAAGLDVVMNHCPKIEWPRHGPDR